MSKLTVIAVALCLTAATTSPLAAATQRSVARLVGIQGNVLVSNDNAIASAGEALRLSPGMRVLPTLNSAATIEYDDGCRVTVRAGERAEIRAGHACPARGMQPAGFVPVIGVRR
jgi:hypothetical protein